MRRFEFRDAKSSKFWEVDQQGAAVIVRFGRVGTDGQTKRKDLGSAAKAAAEVDKLVRDKTGKGYVEQGGEATAPPAKAASRTEARAAAEAPASVGAKGRTKGSVLVAEAKPGATKKAPAPSPATSVAEGDLPDGGETTVAGSGSSRYTLRNTGGVYSCTCPAWRNQSVPIERRTCKHLRRFRGEAAEEARLGALPQRAPSTSSAGAADAPPLLLAHRWEEQDPAGWWMSEKLDGVRAYWDGRRFVSRLGNAYLAPDWFRDGLPPFPLDGELFAGRGAFQKAVSVARRSDAGEGWRTLSYVIFDAPQVDGGFEDRLDRLEEHFAAHAHEHARVLDHRVCEGVDDLVTELRRIEALGGEGVMLRQPGSRYVAGRSDTLLKVKSFLDTEARVVGHQAGTGRHKGRMGALHVELADGTRFKVGTGFSDAERDNPAAVGEVITVRYQELTDGGVPRFPIYVGVRFDVDWAAMVAAASRKR